MASEGVRLEAHVGTIGCLDSGLYSCGRFFPKECKDTAKKMEYYSSQFPCVEIDSTSYAFPTDATIETWIKATPEGFRFHLKPLGILCGLSIRTAALPRPIREDSKKQQVSLSDLSHESVEYLWHRTNTLFLKFADAERLGCAIFQFPLSFKPGEGQLDKVLLCRQRLHERVPMAVEFRERLWLTGAQLEKTVTFCRAHNLALVIADDLKHELYWPERERLGLDPGKPEQMPMPVRLSHRDFLFARIHRREGKMRLLSDEEVAAWGRRVRSVLDDGLLEEQLQFERTKAATTATEEAEEGSAPVTSTQAQEVAEAASTSSSKPKRVVRFDILVGTDVEDQSVVNARRIRDACGELGLRWDDHCKEEAIGWYSKKRSSAQALTNFFGAVPAEAQVESAFKKSKTTAPTSEPAREDDEKKKEDVPSPAKRKPESSPQRPSKKKEIAPAKPKNTLLNFFGKK